MAVPGQRIRLEVLPNTKDRAFDQTAYRKPSFDFIWHQHPQFELTYIRKGHGVRYVGNSVLPFQAGDLCLIGSDLPHAYGSDRQNSADAEWSVIHFSPETLGLSFWNLPETQGVKALLNEGLRGLAFSLENAPLSHRLLKANSPLTFGAFFQILEELAGVKHPEYLNPQAFQLNVPIDPRLGKLFEWIHLQDLAEIRQIDAAATLNLSPASFSRYFRQQTGRVFSRYINEIRIARACNLLAASQRSITEIAMESGFNNLPNFNRRFLEIIKTTPRQYRAMANENPL